MGAGGSTGKQGDLLETMADHEESINCMCVSEDGSMLVTGSEDATARMWATKTEETECIGVLKWVIAHVTLHRKFASRCFMPGVTAATSTAWRCRTPS